MVRGLYTAATGALVAQSQIDVIANNLANVNTTGFKRSVLQAAANGDLALQRIQRDPGRLTGARIDGVPTMVPVGNLGTGAVIYDTPQDTGQGALQQTSNPFDLALSGPGYFTVQAQNGNVRYTRDGSFVRDAQGRLATANGDLVLGQTGPMQIPDGQLSVDTNGAVSVGTRRIDQLQIVQFPNGQSPRPDGYNRTSAQLGAPVAATGTTVVQNHLERSNADVVRSMVDLITAQRWFDANMKIVQAQDDITGQSIANVGHTK